MKTDPAASKIVLRRELRKRRRALLAKDHGPRSALAAKAVLSLPRFSATRRVAIYLPFDGEVDTARLVREARRRNVRLYAPVVVDRRRGIIRFHPLTAKTRRGAYGILAPHRNSAALPARWFDLIVVPLVGVDPEGRRLGMGGGFYDRALKFRRLRSQWMGPQLVGFAFDCQRVESVHSASWDVRLDALATETGFKSFPR